MGLPQTPIESRLIIPGARTTPWRHQEEAVEFVRALYSSGQRGAMICADMGTGKTAMAVYTALLHGFHEIVVVGPLRVVQVWKPQIELHSAVPFVVGPLDGTFPSVSAKRAEAERLMKLARGRGAPLAIIVNFESVWRSPLPSGRCASVGTSWSSMKSIGPRHPAARPAASWRALARLPDIGSG